MITPTASEGTWRLGSAAVVITFAFDPLGNWPNSVVLAVVLLAALQAFVSAPANGKANVGLLVILAVMIFIAALEILNPNVPSMEVGLIGFRKSSMFLLGLVIGLGWRGSRMQGLRLTWWCMFVAAAVSLVVYLAFPSIEHSIHRASGQEAIGGVVRMGGLLAGSFHVAMLGAFLFVSSLAPGIVIRPRWARLAGAAVGLACVYFAQVRTGIVAVAIGALAMTLLSGSARRLVNRIVVLVSVVVLGVVYINPLTEYVRHFVAFRILVKQGLQESRFTRRYERWSESLDMIDRSPFVGYGSGSAGDTLGPVFVGGEHVTPHNVFLKYAVEGGVFQGLLFASLFIGLIVALRPSRDSTRLATAAGAVFLVFTFVIEAVEAIPVSFGLAVILGLCAQRQKSSMLTANSEERTLRWESSQGLNPGNGLPQVAFQNTAPRSS